MKTEQSKKSSTTLKATVEKLTAEVERLKGELDKARKEPIRRRLPDTRDSITHKFQIGEDHEGYVTVGLYEDGRPGEVFIKMAKEGSTIGGLTDTIGILTSVLLQSGIPLDVLVTKLSHTRFEPSGITSDPDIRFAKSPVDYIFRWLGNQFAEKGDHDLTKESLPPREA